ncbi:hypothetical protein XA68_15253 [Ophiocordyceps unilateralis]|uniref:Uncharacterized protein n=1 Tax=Ophiocordyceps unilateralis TaxID=268505 RepID=A0A2A9P7W5_OPHUN|nr:hypothetical protein XA68_15253 [Ophiocordyceps unilateralis]
MVATAAVVIPSTVAAAASEPYDAFKDVPDTFKPHWKCTIPETGTAAKMNCVWGPCGDLSQPALGFESYVNTTILSRREVCAEGYHKNPGTSCCEAYDKPCGPFSGSSLWCRPVPKEFWSEKLRQAKAVELSRDKNSITLVTPSSTTATGQKPLPTAVNARNGTSAGYVAGTAPMAAGTTTSHVHNTTAPIAAQATTPHVHKTTGPIAGKPTTLHIHSKTKAFANSTQAHHGPYSPLKTTSGVEDKPLTSASATSGSHEASSPTNSGTASSTATAEDKVNHLYSLSQSFNFEIRGGLFAIPNMPKEAATVSWRLIQELTVAGEVQQRRFYFEICEPKDQGRVVTKVQDQYIYGYTDVKASSIIPASVSAEVDVSASVKLVIHNNGPQYCVVEKGQAPRIQPVDESKAKELGVPDVSCSTVDSCRPQTKCEGAECRVNLVAKAEVKAEAKAEVKAEAKAEAKVEAPVTAFVFEACQQKAVCSCVRTCDGDECNVQKPVQGTASPPLSAAKVKVMAVVALTKIDKAATLSQAETKAAADAKAESKAAAIAKAESKAAATSETGPKAAVPKKMECKSQTNRFNSCLPVPGTAAPTAVKPAVKPGVAGPTEAAGARKDAPPIVNAGSQTFALSFNFLASLLAGALLL